MPSLDKKIFGVLFFSIFSAVTGVGIVVPLLPVYAHSLGSSGIYIGLIFGAFSLSRTFFLPYFGRQSDMKGRKPFIVIGLLAYAIISIAFIFTESIETLILVRFIQGIASAMIMPVSQAYVGDITPVGREGFVMGLFNLSMFLGLGIGPIIGGFTNYHFGLYAAFLFMGFFALTGCLLSLFFLPPTRLERVTSSELEPVKWLTLLKDTHINSLFWFRFAHTACIGIIWGFLPIMATLNFSMPSSHIGILVTTGIIVSGIVQVPVGYLADRISKVRLIVFGGIIISISVISFQWSSDFWDMFMASVFLGIGGGMATPALMALAVIKGHKVTAMGSVMSLMTMAHSLGMLAGSLAAGFIMDNFQLQSVFTLGAMIMVVSTGLVLIIFNRSKNDMTT